MNYRLAIFDFDGTLADSFPFFMSVFNEIADQHGFRRVDADQAERLRHYGPRDIMRHVGMPAWKLPLASRSFIERMRDNAGRIPLFEGVAETLGALDRHGVELAVVSSNSEQNVRLVLGPDLAALVRQYECGMSIFGKTARIRKVVRRAGVRPEQALYIGDQATDADAARKAGVGFGAVSWGYAPIEALRRCAPACEFAAPRDLLGLGRAARKTAD
jgi:phosphoglycolate phosphatase